MLVASYGRCVIWAAVKAKGLAIAAARFPPLPKPLPPVGHAKDKTLIHLPAVEDIKALPKGVTLASSWTAAHLSQSWCY
eukprot:scaffold25121_cov21-Tisochrysis_lutea.AAC.4